MAVDAYLSNLTNQRALYFETCTRCAFRKGRLYILKRSNWQQNNGSLPVLSFRGFIPDFHKQ